MKRKTTLFQYLIRSITSPFRVRKDLKDFADDLNLSEIAKDQAFWRDNIIPRGDLRKETLKLYHKTHK